MPNSKRAAEAPEVSLRQEKRPKKRWVILFEISSAPVVGGPLWAVDIEEAHDQMREWLIQEGRVREADVPPSTPAEGIKIGDAKFRVAAYGSLSQVEGFLPDHLEASIARFRAKLAKG